MFLDINKIGCEGLAFERRLDLPDLEGSGGEAIPVADAFLRGGARPGPGGIDLSARLEATVRLTCSRCLQAFSVPISTDFRLTLVHAAAEAGSSEAEVREEDALLFYSPEGKADLGQMATEQIYLSLPLKPVCQEGCQGLCATCGANRNEGTCGCSPESIDPRLAPLLDFKKRKTDA